MRHNKFGETYCHTAAEALPMIDEHGGGVEAVYVPQIYPPEDDFGACAEIATNHNGDLVCWIEAPTGEAVRAILAELEIEAPLGTLGINPCGNWD